MGDNKTVERGNREELLTHGWKTSKLRGILLAAIVYKYCGNVDMLALADDEDRKEELDGLGCLIQEINAVIGADTHNTGKWDDHDDPPADASFGYGAAVLTFSDSDADEALSDSSGLWTVFGFIGKVAD